MDTHACLLSLSLTSYLWQTDLAEHEDAAGAACMLHAAPNSCVIEVTASSVLSCTEMASCRKVICSCRRMFATIHLMDFM